MIGKDVEVKILEVNGNQVRIGITAPRATVILRKELEAREQDLAKGRIV